MAGRKVKQQKEIEQLSPEALEKEIEKNKLENSYDAFNKHISNFILANK